MTRIEKLIGVLLIALCTVNVAACLCLFHSDGQQRATTTKTSILLSTTVDLLGQLEKVVEQQDSELQQLRQQATTGSVQTASVSRVVPLVCAREPERSVQQALNWLTPLKDMLQEQLQAEQADPDWKDHMLGRSWYTDQPYQPKTVSEIFSDPYPSRDMPSDLFWQAETRLPDVD